MNFKKINQKQLQEMCEAILAKQGIDYKDWLYQQQLNILIENTDLLTKALKNE